MRKRALRDVRLADSDVAGDPVLITGGAGFIGTNLAHRLMSAGTNVIVLDDLSRPGVEWNLEWLRARHGPRLRVELGDIRDRAALARAARPARRVVHLAAQVAVTTSLTDPLHDFEVNAGGTLNLLTVLGSMSDPPPLLFTSTNKVYGALDDLPLRAEGNRYVPVDEQIRRRGIDESRPLDFQSPYGCSKGAADQYVSDFARTAGLPAVVFRMSCIYGPHQFGTSDQGWVTHFLIRALAGEPIMLYGDGLQVRDLLFVDDLIDAILIAFENMDALSGHVFNMGGGPANSTSLIELIESIADLCGVAPDVMCDAWRAGDQRYYVSDTSRFTSHTGWAPSIPVSDGLRRLRDWLLASGIPALGGPPRQSWTPGLATTSAVAGQR